ncbi:MAG: four helix bundle protein [Rhizobacter sp.]|nr:four helix bundle protein [Ferruginibacter sp.]
MQWKQKKYDLEDRLIRFACICLSICELLPATKSGQNPEYQLCKSGTAAALIYGEAQVAESSADFIHKIKLVLKDVRETSINLRIINEKPVIKNELIPVAQKECNELMAIFIKSIETARSNQHKIKIINTML